ncbi:2-phosphosulfolactate phosphatase [Nocardia sp. NPDC050378]|uniref:2-phosphosulfolactate phosphatase n=1 Tax=Nocardia sp. NPDC050378 TaxID=3155400 RepID=UPI0033C777AF
MSPRWAQQEGFGIRLDWGPTGAAVIGAGAAGVVVVDVLSFTTAVSVAVSAGTAVYPYRWRDDSAQVFAARKGAELAVGRRAVDAAHPWSLSPAAIRRAPFTDRLVLPSPNGSTIASAVVGAPVVAACFRNADAVATWIAERRWGTPEQPIAIVPAGERWADDATLRPAVEDLLGAGALVATLIDRGCGRPSPEARCAAAAFLSVTNIGTELDECASGRELRSGGFGDDVDIAAQINADTVVPVLADGAFTDHSPEPPAPPAGGR